MILSDGMKPQLIKILEIIKNSYGKDFLKVMDYFRKEMPYSTPNELEVIWMLINLGLYEHINANMRALIIQDEIKNKSIKDLFK